MKVAAQSLEAGDILSSGQIVLARPQGGLNTPRGKVEIRLRGGRGEYVATRGRRTTVSVKREVRQ